MGIISPIYFKLYLLTKVPLAFVAGVALEKVTENAASVSINYNWLNKNPFKSTYFAALAMAAEAASGVMCMMALKNHPNISMLILAHEGKFLKKGRGKTVFTCNDASKINNAVNEAALGKEATEVTCISIGRNAKNEEIAIFSFTWSFKVRNHLK